MATIGTHHQDNGIAMCSAEKTAQNKNKCTRIFLAQFKQNDLNIGMH